jgi:hypothetical protein
MDAITDAYGGDVGMFADSSTRVHHPSVLYQSHPDRCLGRNRGGFTTIIHVLTDDDGLLVKLVITPDLTHDIQAAAGPYL